MEIPPELSALRLGVVASPVCSVKWPQSLKEDTRSLEPLFRFQTCWPYKLLCVSVIDSYFWIVELHLKIKKCVVKHINVGHLHKHKYSSTIFLYLKIFKYSDLLRNICGRFLVFLCPCWLFGPIRKQQWMKNSKFWHVCRHSSLTAVTSFSCISYFLLIQAAGASFDLSPHVRALRRAVLKKEIFE